MTRTKLPVNPFSENNGAALVTRENGGLTHHSGSALPSRQASSLPLNPFSNHNEVLPREKSPIAMEAFSSRRESLPCRDSSNLPAPAPFRDLDLRIYCCGKPLEMEVADMQGEGPDAIPGGQINIIDRVLHGTCSVCKREHHHSVGEVVSQDQFR